MDPALFELMEGDPEDEVAALIRLRDAEEAPPGVRIVSRFGEVATCRLKRGAILETRFDQNVLSLKAAHFLEEEPGPDGLGLEFDFEEGEHTHDERRPAGLPETGRGTVVGVVDWGVDFAHPDFRNADGSTRLLALWDQRGGPRAGSPAPYGYGIVHSREAINRALAAPDPYAALGYHPADADLDRNGTHGTHVLSIAAGNGRGDGPAGIAPEADLVFVHMDTTGTAAPANLGDSVSLPEAVDFIFTTAAGRPCVINLSLGRHWGAHDGSSLVEQALDAIVSAAPGRAVCQSSGNYFDRRIHAAGQLRPGEVQALHWETDEADVTRNELEVWYSFRDRMAVEVVAPDGTRSRRIGIEERETLRIDGRVVCRIYQRAHEPNNHDHHINVFLYPTGPAGTWTVRLIGEDIVDGRFHAWIERDAACRGCQSKFSQRDADPATTTGSICNGFRTIAVGAYNAHSPERPLAPFSSAGPTRDGRVKPDLAAPGVGILAARSARRDAETPLLTRKSGTSMASPHVTGTVACLFEAAGRPLPIETTRRLLLETADTEGRTAETVDRLGSGYLEIERAMESARRLRGGAEAMAAPVVARAREGGENAMNAGEAMPGGGRFYDEWERTDEHPGRALAAIEAESWAQEDSEDEALLEAEAHEVAAEDFEGEAIETEDVEIEEIEALTLDLPDAASAAAEAGQDEAAFAEARPCTTCDDAFADAYDAVPDLAPIESDEGEPYEISPAFPLTVAPATPAGFGLVEIADAVVSAGPTRAGALLDAVVGSAAVGEAIGAAGLPSPARLFDQVVAGRFGSGAVVLEGLFTTVALPGARLAEDIEAGDLLLRRVAGEPGPGHLAVIAGPELWAHDELAGAGLRGERRGPGRYARVVEGGPFPHRLADGHARLVVDSAGRLPADQLILRPARAAFEALDLPGEEVNRRSREYAIWVQSSLNELMDAGLAVDGIVGRKTRAATAAFQRQKGLVADGIVGRITERAMMEAGAPPPPGMAAPPEPPPLPLPPLPSIVPASFGSGQTVVPVIIVPGIMGTRLVDPESGALVWNPTGFPVPSKPCTGSFGAFAANLARLMDPAPLAPSESHDIPSWRCSDRFAKAERIPHFGNFVAEFYDELAFALSDPAFNAALRARTGKTLVVMGCGYDWRQDNTDSAARVRDIVAEAKRLPGVGRDGKVILIGHSMGGLVSRAYCKILSGEGNVAALILLGSPTHGAPQAYRTLKTGISLSRDFLLSALFPATRRITLMRMLRGFPSAYQLLPTRHYTGAHTDWLTFDPTLGAPLRDAADADAVYSHAHTGFLDGTNGSPALDTRVSRALALRTRFDTALFDPATGCYMPDPTFIFFSSGLATEEKYKLEGGGGRAFDVKVVASPADGDGTVPRFSATADGCGHIVLRRDMGSVKHDKLPNDPRVIGEIKVIIERGIGAPAPTPPVPILA